jgi:hypothetical protein
LRAGLSGMEGDGGDRKRRNQATNGQGHFSGKVQGGPNLFRSKAIPVESFLRFLPGLNNPWNRATARHEAAIIAPESHHFSQKRPCSETLTKSPGRFSRVRVYVDAVNRYMRTAPGGFDRGAIQNSYRFSGIADVIDLRRHTANLLLQERFRFGNNT